MSEPVHLYARHGQTKANIQNVFRSRMDVPLDPKGEAEAHQAAVWLKQRYPVQLIISSPMQRAKQTAEIYGQHFGIQPQVDARLAPWDAGVLTGMPRTPKTEKMRDFYIQHADIVIPQGESIMQSENRAMSLLQDVAKFPGRVLMVTHGSGIKAADTVTSGHREPTGDSALVEPGGIVGVFHSGDKFELRPLFKGAEVGVHS